MTKTDTSKIEWDYSDLVSGDLDKQIEKEKKIISDKVSDFELRLRKDKSYLENPSVLKKILDEMDVFFSEFGHWGDAGYYLWLRGMKDQTDDGIKAKNTLMEDFVMEMSNKLAFFSLSLSKIPIEKQKEFLKFEGLKDYRHYLERLFVSGKYSLGEEAEKVMTLKSGPAYDSWVSMTSELLSKEERSVFTGKKKEMKTFSEIKSLMDSRNKKVRDSAAEAFNEVLAKHADVATAELNAIFQNKKVDDGLRGFSRSDESRIISDDIDFDFVDTLTGAVKKKYSITKKYYELKAKLFGVKKLKYHERNVPYGSVTKEIPYSEAVEIVYDSFNKTDSEFGKIFRRIVESGNIDVYPSRGKRDGAFCSSDLKKHLTRILLNYAGSSCDVRVLAHESGHGLNHELMKKQNSFNFGVPMVVSEVASTFAESAVFGELLKKISDDEEKLAMLMDKLKDDLASVQRQIACYNFEKELHDEFRKKGHLSGEEIGKIFQKNMSDYMGDFVEMSSGSENWWVYWSHIREFFYVYSYASGVLISQAMIKKVEEDSGFVLKVKDFLSAGTSSSPREIFENLGIKIDRNFWNAGLDKLEEMLNEAWGLAEKLGKI